MNTDRKTAIIVGALFIVAAALNPIGMAIYESILNAPDYLVNAYPNKIQVLIGILLDFLCVPLIVLIPVMLFPILKQHNERLALGYVVFRILEVAIHIVTIFSTLSLLTLSQEYVNAGAPDLSYFQTLGNSIHAEIAWNDLIYMIVFTLGAPMFYYILYQSKLIPRWISVWCIIAPALLFAGALLGMFDLIDTSKIMIFLGSPVALGELILSVWLIAKGFNSSAIASESA